MPPPIYNRTNGSPFIRTFETPKIARDGKFLALGKLPTYNPPLRTFVTITACKEQECGSGNASNIRRGRIAVPGQRATTGEWPGMRREFPRL